jgi:hypothetical protein
MAQSWENVMPEELEQNELSEKWASGRATIARAFSALLQQAWLSPVHQLVSLRFLLSNIFARYCLYMLEHSEQWMTENVYVCLWGVKASYMKLIALGWYYVHLLISLKLC